jgi:hypothetical protein
MMATRGDRAAVLVMRVWVEDASAAGFRARIVELAEGSAQMRTIGLAATPDAASELVREWLLSRLPPADRHGV